MSMSSQTVFLLRAPTSEPDRYESALREASFLPQSLPVLETSLLVSGLKYILRKGPEVDGVIVTSQRSAEAWGRAVDGVLEQGGSALSHKNWSDIPFYTVGPSTASILTSLAGPTPSPARTALCPSDVRGSDSGSSEKLAHFILSDRPGPARLLYLTGDKNRDTLPKIIEEGSNGRVSLLEEQVYETHGIALDAFEGDLVSRMDNISGTPWIVFFAPSSSKHVLPMLMKHFALARNNVTAVSAPSSPIAWVAAIGPTTADFLRDECGLLVHAVPPKPTADLLAQCLREKL
ncbi:tetrapyrrole biosynthesis, uroporphyrinogen III synthase [Peniophora sp. CONT]|nr:tetrapyrrole biosynthesis, uroporphyrinogen III synthase [Peniophora sp. CONT]